MVDLNFGLFEVVVEAIDDISLHSFPAFTIRGGFGKTLKNIVCIKKDKKCENCFLQYNCVYIYIFETHPPQNTTRLKKYKSIPRPFIFYINPDKQHYVPKDILKINFTLIGNCLNYLSLFICTLEALSQKGLGKTRGKFKIKDVFAMDISEQNYSVYDASTLAVSLSFPTIQFSDVLAQAHLWNSHLLKIKFITPVVLRYQGNVCQDAPFHIFIRNLLRRIYSLAYFHCGYEIVPDIKKLIHIAEGVKVIYQDLRWQRYVRYSSRQKQDVSVGGLVGEAWYENVPKELIPYILAGRYLHIGKATVWGFGKYEII